MSGTVIGVWMGLRRCGCPVAVCTVDTRFPDKWVDQSKREFLKAGHQVVYASWQDWLEKYSPLFVKDCPHKEIETEDAASTGALGSLPSEAQKMF